MLINYQIILDTIKEVGTRLTLTKAVFSPENPILGIPEQQEFQVVKLLPGYLADNLAQVAIENGVLQTGDLIAFVAAHALPDLDEDHRILYERVYYKINIAQVIRHRGKTMLYKLNLIRDFKDRD